MGLIGRVPFWLAAAIFVAMFTILFEWQSGQPCAGARAAGSAKPSCSGSSRASAVTLVFEKVFYVRLP